MRSVGHWLVDLVEREHRYVDLSRVDLAEVDLFVADRHDLEGIVLGEEVVALHRRWDCSARLRLHNLERMRDFVLLKLSPRPDKAYVASYLDECADNPYALRNVLYHLRLGHPVRDLTRFPPLNARKTLDDQRQGLDRLRALSRAGDLVLTARRDSGLSLLIRKTSHGQFSHVGMVRAPGELAEVTTAGGMVSEFDRLYETVDYDVALYRLRDLDWTPEQEATLQRYWRNQISYSWWGALWAFVARRLHLPIGSAVFPGDLPCLHSLDLVAWV